MARKDATQVDRLPPHALESERGVLGCILLNPTECLMYCIQQFPGPEVFYDLRHRKVYELLCVMHEDREPIDMITVQQRLKDAGHLDAVGGLPYLASLSDGVPNASHIAHYVPIVFEKFKRRSMIHGCTEIIARCYDERSDEDSPESSVEMMQRDLLRISQTGRKGDWSVKGAIQEALKDIEQDIKSGGALTGLPTGFEDIDRTTRGLQAQDFIVIAARPSVGKSSLVMNMADHIAVEKHIPVGVFSLEMSKKSVMRRMISARARIDLFHFPDDLFTQQAIPSVSSAAGTLATAPLYVDDSRGLDDAQLRSRIRQMYHELGIKLVIIDYLQLLTARKRFDNRAQEVAYLSKGMKDIAGELNIPVLVVAQLNREVENRKGERPRISDLKESGAIEQDADLIGLAYATKNEDELDDSTVPSALFIGKQRNGPTGTIRLMFERPIFRFFTPSKIRDQDVPREPYKD